MSAVIESRGLSAGYADTTVVRDLDLRVEPGEVVALLGPNGAGKTTTIMTLSGVLPPHGGEVLWAGRPTTVPLHLRCRDGLGVVTEKRAVLMSLTVLENLRVARADVDRALELFPELRPHVKRRVSHLSGGQHQMLAVARALARRPKALLIDELSLGLAPAIVSRLLHAVRAAADDGVAVLLIEQHLHKALQVADRAYVLRRGRVELSGTAADLRDRIDSIQASYLSTETPPVGAEIEQRDNGT